MNKTTTVTYRAHYTNEEYDLMSRVYLLKEWTVDYKSAAELARDWDIHGMAHPDDRWVEIVAMTCTKEKLSKEQLEAALAAGEKLLELQKDRDLVEGDDWYWRRSE